MDASRRYEKDAGEVQGCAEFAGPTAGEIMRMAKVRRPQTTTRRHPAILRVEGMRIAFIRLSQRPHQQRSQQPRRSTAHENRLTES